MHTARRWLPRPGIGARVAAGALTIVGLLPLLLRLPKVSVVACFDAGHPLYEWVATTGFSGDVHCVSAPTPAVSWTLMIAATLLVQLLLLPLLITAGALLVRGALRLATSAHRALAAALVELSALVVPQARPVPVPVRVRYQSAARSRENPRRGPPSRSC
nr:hypothetical protein [Propionicimonas sp.]